MFCDKLFKGIEEKAGSGTQFEVKFSMLEIYNEVARDLLDSAAMKKKAGLKIRQVSFCLNVFLVITGFQKVLLKTAEKCSVAIQLHIRMGFFY